MRCSGKLAFLASFGFILAAPTPAQQILETYSASLTTFLPSGSTATAVQGIRPHVQQRGVGIDGTIRAAPAFAMALAGNPYENAWVGKESQGNLRIDLGAYAPLDIDIALPAKGIPWLVGRSYNSRQVDASANPLTSNGYQGKNWQQTSQPEILLYDDNDNTKDVICLVYRADAYIEFQSTNSSATRFKAKNGAAGVIEKSAGSPDTYIYHAQNGFQFTFLGFNTSGNTHNGLLWKVSDEDGTPSVAYVGHASSASSAISSGWDASGRILYAYDATDRRYTYSYTTLDSVLRLTEVKAETKSGGTWTSPTGLVEVAKVNYAYYGDESYGDIGDLKKVTITTPLSDSGVSQTRKKYYRYWEGTSDNVSSYDAGASPPRLGYVHQIKMVVGFEGARRVDWDTDGNLDEDYTSTANDDLKPYAESYFEYNTSRQVNKAFSNGSCGCGTSTDGNFEYTYGTNGSYTDNSGYDLAWKSRTVVERPDGAFLTQYFDEAGQGLGQVITDVVPTSGGTIHYWATWPERSTTGIVEYLHLPDNLSSYTHSTGTFTALTGAGVVYVLVRESSGNKTGFLSVKKVKEGDATAHGNDGSATYIQKLTWDATTFAVQYTDAAATVVRPLVLTVHTYPSEQTSDASYLETSYTYAAGSYSGLLYETVTTTLPAVTTANNGSNSSNTRSAHYRQDLRVDFEKQEDGRIDYHVYTNGQETTTIIDVTTGSPTPPTGFSSTGTPLDQKTSVSFNAQGMQVSQTMHELDVTARRPQTYRSKLLDERMVVLHFPEMALTSPSTYYGPARYEVVNHAGKVEVSGMLGLSDTDDLPVDFIAEGESDPLTAIDLASVAQMRVSMMDESGTHVEEERAYFVIPASGAGSAGTNYDATVFGYDTMGRRWRVKEPSGTIRRTVYDAIGRQSTSWIGTNDYSFSGGEASGPDNMVKTDTTNHDGGSDKGNSLVTSVARYVVSTTTDQRVTSFLYDYRGRRIVELPPLAPFTLNKYDNMGRSVARGLYSSSSGLDAGDNPTSLATNRMALSETAYDEMGRTWKTTRHKIDDADGSDDDTLDSKTWFDSRGRAIEARGEQYTKTAYDRLGRVTDEYVLAKTDDTVYADADDVTGDIVLEQHETRYDETKADVLMSVAVQRMHNDISGGETTGKLDTNADADDLLVTAANLEGRPQITATWYDTIGRVTNTVQLGTNSDANYDRDGASVPSRSDTALVTTTAYNTDGTVDTVTDPRGKITDYTYDALGRRTKEIKGYVDGTPGTGTDDDVTVVYEYTNGLRTKLKADLPSGQTDQETLYIYGSTAGTPSAMKITTGHLLRAVRYPDSGNGGDTLAEIDSDSSDVVSYAYNAQGQETYKKDQAATVLESVYDDNGRRTINKATTLGSGIDSAIRRVENGYDTLGRASTVVQYDATSSGSATDGVAYAYDDWGNVATYEEDRDSAVSGGGNQYTTSYTWAKGTDGRYTLRKTGMTLPDSRAITYTYRSAGGLHDLEYSRVTLVVDGAVTLAQYDYLGVGTVVRTKLNEIACMSRVYNDSNAIVDLDLFNRVTTNRWTKDLGTDRDFYQVALGYDRDSNITSAEDNVHVGYDVKYTMDSVNRLTQAEEGTLSGGSITSKTRDEQWTLNHTGNWDREKLNLNGDADFTDSGELDDTRTHNAVNELTARDTDSNSSNNYTLAYDAAGNMTDDGKDYEYVYDAWGRLRKVNNTSNQALIAEYRYNGLNHRIGVHEDTEPDGDVDANDKWYYDAFDESWRQLARYRESDSSPKEDFVPHQAGAGGHGGSSYIDLVICRNKDKNTAWTTASDGVLEERTYLCQNWRADVSALVKLVGSNGAELREWAKYSAYGTPIGLPGGDTDSDTDCDGTDVTQVQTWIDAPAYDVRGDIDLDGDVDATDKSTINGSYSGITLGRGSLSATGVLNRKGYAGYEALSGLTGSKWLARNRVLAADLGRWLQRDSEHYRDSCSLYDALKDNPLRYGDPHGTACGGAGCASTGGSGGSGTYLALLRAMLQQQQTPPDPCNSPDGLAPNADFCNEEYGDLVVHERICLDGSGTIGGWANQCSFGAMADLIRGMAAGLADAWYCRICIDIYVRPACMCSTTPNSPLMNCQRACMACNMQTHGTVTGNNDVACKQQCEDELGQHWTENDCHAVADSFMQCATFRLSITCKLWDWFSGPGESQEIE